MDKIKTAESTIKALKDYIEVEKANRKAVTSTAVNTLTQLENDLINLSYEYLETIKQGE